jgi:hypothetical protein
MSNAEFSASTTGTEVAAAQANEIRGKNGSSISSYHMYGHSHVLLTLWFKQL